MPTRHSSPVHLDVTVGREVGGSVPAPEIPFRIAVLGDFSGRANREIVATGSALAARRPVRVDRDNVELVLAGFRPELALPAVDRGDSQLRLEFTTLEDFHPDRLFQRLPLFRPIRETRARLTDPATRAEAIEGLVGAAAPAPGGAESGPPQDAPEDLLERVLDETTPVEARAVDLAHGDLHAFLQRIVAPHLVPGVDPRESELLNVLDEAVGAQLRAILHQPDFQGLEALWRGIDFLTRRVETTAQLQIHLVDVSKVELVADLAPGGEVERSGLYRLLVESSVGTFGGGEWALLVGAYSFGPGSEEIEVVGRLAGIAKAAGAPWISAADPALAGWKSFDAPPDPSRPLEPEPAWGALRRLPDAPWLGLALPRFLLRLPYGAESDPCELLPFEELESREHSRYLWGNPALVCALLLARSFVASGWALHPGEDLEVTGLPLDLYRVEGETMAKPCAETLMTDRLAMQMSDRGFMPLASLKDSDAVRLVRFQSVADPPVGLAGRWVGSTRG